MRRRTHGRLAPALFLALAAVSCTPETGEPTAVHVAVTLHPVGLLVQPLLPEGTKLVVLVPEGVSPHAFDPLPSSVRAAATAALVVGVAPTLDVWLTPDDRTVWLDDGLGPDDDPHGWLDPVWVREHLRSLAAGLCRVEALCEGMEARLAGFDSALAQLDAALRARGPYPPVVLSAPFLSRFADRYAMPVRAVVAPVEGVEPSAAAIRSAIAAAASAHVVVGQALLPDRSARLVAEAAGVRLVTVDPIGTERTAPTYAALLTAVADNLLRNP